jgi:hypothetical protein
MLQQHSSLKTIKKKLIRKALDMIRKIAEEDPDEYSNKDKTGNEFCCNKWPCHILYIYSCSTHKIFCNQMKRKVKWRRRRASMPSSGMSLANQSSSASLKMQLTGTALLSFLDLKGSSLTTVFIHC